MKQNGKQWIKQTDRGKARRFSPTSQRGMPPFQGL
jgi:hypothetical protein